jgi:DNA-binding transcriptional LysR family regulator
VSVGWSVRSRCELHNYLTQQVTIAKMNRPPSDLNFDWALVRSFLAVLDAGSLLGAAKKLKASQPTLGRQVAELERQLGLALFERTGRGLVPTDSALRLADAARGMQVAALDLAAAASTHAAVAAGIVTLSASTPVSHGLLPPLLARMAEDLPQIRIDVIATNAVSNLLQREADIALRMVQPEQLSTVAKRVGWGPSRMSATWPRTRRFAARAI